MNSQGIVIINASLLDHMKLTRVWAEIKPPDQNIADSKQVNVPSFITCEMNLKDNNIYQGHSDLFFHEGHYQIIVYGLDHTATLVNPTFAGIDIGENVQKKKQHSLEDMQLIQMKSHSCRQIFNWLTMH
ncbi:MAG: hypothetical protein OMM_03901 [Candidatus Magnetoglobus multicellularis str. Araruama]|uniref:Uncharacterized protein n=1 Tax=Candidatus Magnetoglobus multicellularis str. Araruama TaxID=890399 RepID=A0A1V1P3T1_9BACT|nr:MAG: hypothetical protein OMM_03901 [Candidatus Magnetoglobus multicellularis str. Araruama]